MLLEKHALLDHADRCRRIAREIEHARASERLITMAQEYEARAAMFEVPETAKGSLEQPVGSIAEAVKQPTKKFAATAAGAAH